MKIKPLFLDVFETLTLIYQCHLVKDDWEQTQSHEIGVWSTLVIRETTQNGQLQERQYRGLEETC